MSEKGCPSVFFEKYSAFHLGESVADVAKPTIIAELCLKLKGQELTIP